MSNFQEDLLCPGCLNYFSTMYSLRTHVKDNHIHTKTEDGRRAASIYVDFVNGDSYTKFLKKIDSYGVEEIREL